MLKVGITGSIGSGKTTVCRIFQILGVPVYHADDQARKFLFSENVKDALLAFHGEEIFDHNGNIDRKKLASVVFNHQEALNHLNELIHPLVQSDFQNWYNKQAGNQYILHEAAILIESGFNKMFDRIVVVTAPYELRLHRLLQRDKISVGEINRRMINQMDDAEKNKYADYIIDNDEQRLLIPHVLEVHEALGKQSKEDRASFEF